MWWPLKLELCQALEPAISHEGEALTGLAELFCKLHYTLNWSR